MGTRSGAASGSPVRLLPFSIETDRFVRAETVVVHTSLALLGARAAEELRASVVAARPHRRAGAIRRRTRGRRARLPLARARHAVGVVALLVEDPARHSRSRRRLDTRRGARSGVYSSVRSSQNRGDGSDRIVRSRIQRNWRAIDGVRGRRRSNGLELRFTARRLARGEDDERERRDRYCTHPIRWLSIAISSTHISKVCVLTWYSCQPIVVLVKVGMRY